MNADIQSPYGHHAIASWRERLAKSAGHYRGRKNWLSSIMRKVALSGVSEPIDSEPFAGMKVRLYPSSNHTDKRSIMGLPFDDGIGLDAMRRTASGSPDGTFNFVDIGANVGMYTIAASLIASQTGVTPRLIAVEANPAVVDLMNFNLEASGVAGVHVAQCAVSDKDGSVMLDLTPADLGSVFVSEDAGTEGRIEVPSRMLIDILAEAGMERIDFLKIDVEGHELAVLAPFFESAPPSLHPGSLIAEVKHDEKDGIGPLLEQHGYRMAESTGDDAIFVKDESRS